MRDRPKLTGPQLSALVQADQRLVGEPWRGDKGPAEQCCDLGLLEAVHLSGVRSDDPASIVYQLTEAGRVELAGRR